MGLSGEEGVGSEIIQRLGDLVISLAYIRMIHKSAEKTFSFTREPTANSSSLTKPQTHPSQVKTEQIPGLGARITLTSLSWDCGVLPRIVRCLG